MSHLFGAILKPSHAKNFTDWWTSSLRDTLASHSPQRESDKVKTTQGTYGHTSETQLELWNPECVSSKMSKDTFHWDSPQSSAIWKNWVTRCRGEYSARLKSAHRTSASGSSSWPSPIASEVRQGFQDRSRGMKGSQESLTTVVVKDAANWPTPQAQDTQRTPEAYAAAKEKRGGKMFLSLNIAAQLHGQAVPANPSTDGSRQGLWATPNTMDCLPPKSPEALARNLQKGGCRNLREDVVYRTGQWATPIMGDSHLASTPEVAQKRIEEGKVTLSRQNPGKLNPRWVETLMGLPVGWVMPSCASPVTIALTNSAYLETELCQQQQQELL